ncbi:hypothetical protein C0Q70_19361 [Pomacea canaliculata]|uniref:Uncharacterized protein n=1 Tax=Pomacea canaliculata TaxID=400727 RepID=A0A2T7NJ49_POMCA|nr:hypothetical protein C0Q70_19361 [Pomacea canaliculata]
MIFECQSSSGYHNDVTVVLDGVQVVLGVGELGRCKGREPAPVEGVAKDGLHADPARLLLPPCVLLLELLDALATDDTSM